MIQNLKTYQVVLFVLANIVLNLLGKLLSTYLTLPMWLDSVGTIITSYVLGPICGMMVGLSLNLTYSLIYNPSEVAFGIVSIGIAVITGIAARRHWFKDLFGAMTLAFSLTLVCTLMGTPLCYLYFGGFNGNIWGDGVTNMLLSWGFKDIFAFIAGNFSLEFVDKVVTVLIAFYVLKRSVFYSKLPQINKRNKLFFMVLLLASVMATTNSANAAETSTEENAQYSYVQTIYDGSNGLPGGTANAITQTGSGILWVGTYGGLYRYNGHQFRLMSEFEPVKNVTALYTDEEGRLWIGTNDNGLSIAIDEKIVNTINKDSGLPTNTVRAITRSSDGGFYIGTTGALSLIRMPNGVRVEKTFKDVFYVISLASDRKGNVAAVTNDGSLYILRDEKVVTKMAPNLGGGYTCVKFDDKGYLYTGTSGNLILQYSLKDNELDVEGGYNTGHLAFIKALNFSDNGNLFVCADNGIGYVDPHEHFTEIAVKGFNSSVDNMTIDYQGNHWFTSSRFGLLRLCKSIFTDIYHKADLDPQVVNAVGRYEGIIYCGTDVGLDLIDEKTGRKIINYITEKLHGIRIRGFLHDSHGNFWICTYGQGLYEISKDNHLKHYDTFSSLNGDKLRTAKELKDGSILVAGNNGVNIIKNERVVVGVGREQGLNNTVVLTTLELSDGAILAGTDGGGLARIEDGKVVRTYDKKDGLSSEVIIRLIKDKEGEGIFVVTSNALCYMSDEKGSNFRILDNFPYFDNYDIVQADNGKLFVLSSAGIYVTDRLPLVNGLKVEYSLLDAQSGLQKHLTANAHDFIDENNNIYLATTGGVMTMNLKQYNIDIRSYRMQVNRMLVDGVVYPVDREVVTPLPKGAKRIEIIPEVINYSLNDPLVSVQLVGFDNEPKVMTSKELTSQIYTNLPVGDYTFHVSIFDGQSGTVLAKGNFPIQKEREIYDNWWFKLYVVLVFAAAIFYMAWWSFRMHIQQFIAMQKKSLAFARKQIELGEETVLTIARTVDAKDSNTSQHSLRVSQYSVMIARKLGFNEKQIEELRQTALLHDIGKIGIPDRVLNKPGRLTDEEFELMKSHVVRGSEILKKFTVVKNVYEGALYHHERWDGRGYVHGLKGEEIPLNARIIGVADAFDAMTANRVYRNQLNFDFVVDEIKKCSGTQFDPRMAKALLECIDDGWINIDELYHKNLARIKAQDERLAKEALAEQRAKDNPALAAVLNADAQVAPLKR